MRSRAEGLALIEAFITEHGVTVLEPFAEEMARKKWRLIDAPMLVNGDGRRNPEAHS